MTLQLDSLNILCPMHLAMTAQGRLRQAGPTLRKLDKTITEGADFFDLFAVYRPREITTTEQLFSLPGTKLQLRLRAAPQVSLKGVLVRDGQGGALINLSFGIGVVDAVRDFCLSGRDFAPTDLAVEMLYLVEAKSAAMAASRHLNTRLRGAMVAAEQRAFTDTLTGLRNRRALNHVLDRLVRDAAPFAVMHLDIDNFKQVNDTMGHAAGDHVLQCIAASMIEATRKDDTVARVGGDEFVIVLPGRLTQDRMADLAKRLIKAVEEPIHYGGKACHVSLSIGISQADRTQRSAENILQEADSATYVSKRLGKAQFTFFEAALTGSKQK